VFNLLIITRDINMKRTLLSFAVLGAVLATGLAQAGGFDRSNQDTSIILKQGNLLEITTVSVTPSVKGTYGATVGGGAITNVAPNYSFTNLAFRTDISDDMALAIIQDEPYGAKVDWTSATNAIDGYKGVKAQIKSSATTALVSYDAADNVTVYGGLKSQSVSASVSNPLVGGYGLSTNTDSSIGYVVGAAFEKPEIAMRVALTYHAKVKHDLAIVESFGGTAAPSTPLSLNTPEAYNLDFQTGIAANTLLFGSMRHAKWTQFLVNPPQYYGAAGSVLKEFTANTTTYSVGLGRKFNDQWSGAVTYGTEAAEGTVGGPMGPTDGFSKVGLGVTYTGEKAIVTLGVQKVNLGDMSLASGPLTAEMSGNTTLVTAVKLGYKF
jgi:long-chain fatty acid transport protein